MEDEAGPAGAGDPDDCSPDARLIAESTADPERFAQLFRRHAAAVHRYLARRLGAELADDCTAEVFIAAFRRRTSYQPLTPTAAPWLYGIAGKVVAQHRRDEARRWALLAALPAEPASVPDGTDAADARLDALAVRPTLVAALRDLSAPDREALLLIAWEQLTPTEAAAALGIPAATVRTRLHRARRLVREALRAAADDELPPALEEMLRHE